MEKYKHEKSEPTPTLADLTIKAIEKALDENNFPGIVQAGERVFYVDTELKKGCEPISNIYHKGIAYIIYGFKVNDERSRD